MSWINYDDVRGQLVSAGFLVDDLEVGRRKRVKVADISQKGWYALHEITLDDGRRALVGAYGWWIGAEKFVYNFKLNIGGGLKALTDDQQSAIRKRLAEDRRAAEAGRKVAAEKAAQAAGQVWRKYSTDGSSDYLARKHVAAHGVRFAPAGNGTFAVPLHDSAGKLWGLQLIRGQGRGRKLEKEYWPAGLSVQGHYHWIGGPAGAVVLVAEGYATAASLFEATGLPVAVAFAAGNLMPVAEALHKRHRGARILVCADDDYLQKCRACHTLTPVADAACAHCGQPHGNTNPGIVAARNAALAVDGDVIVPTFPEGRPVDRKGDTDFNDLAVVQGLPAVRAQVEARLLALRWPVSVPTPARETRSGGEGERAEMPSLIDIDEAVERYAMVYGGKGTWFDDVEHMLVPKSDLQDMLPEHGMRDLRYRKRVVRLSEVGFDPTGRDTAVRCNLWGGWPTTPRPGTCTVLLDLLEYLCSGESDKTARAVFLWVQKWLALPIQQPGAKMRTALVLHGPQGAGKNLFFETVMGIYGEYGRIVDQNAIEDKFNDWASRKLFLIADEVVARQELYHLKNKLKGLITGEWVRINPKNVSAHDERNHVNFVFLSNERQPLILEKDDRRYTVIRTPESLPKSFYADVRAELEAGGMAALHHHLATIDLGDFNEHTPPPMTDAKAAVIEASLGSPDRFVADWKAGHIILSDDGPLPFCPAASSDVYRAYLRWCRLNGEFRPRPSNLFHGDVACLPGWSRGVRDRYHDLNTDRVVSTRFLIPGPKDLEETARTVAADYRHPPDKTTTQWLTECFFAFNARIGADA